MSLILKFFIFSIASILLAASVAAAIISVQRIYMCAKNGYTDDVAWYVLVTSLFGTMLSGFVLGMLT